MCDLLCYFRVGDARNLSLPNAKILLHVVDSNISVSTERERDFCVTGSNNRRRHNRKGLNNAYDTTERGWVWSVLASRSTV